LIGRPSVSSGIDWVRSPFATDPITRVTSAVGRTRSLMSEFTESTQVPHDPVTFPIEARAPILPSLPTTLLRRCRSFVRRSFCSMISFNVEAISPGMPPRLSRRRTPNSPFRNALSVLKSVSLNTESSVRSLTCMQASFTSPQLHPQPMSSECSPGSSAEHGNRVKSKAKAGKICHTM